MKKPTWACGLTTCRERFKNLSTMHTAESLYQAGFGDNLTIFKDDSQLTPSEFVNFVSRQSEPVGAFGNWLLGLWELFLRNPMADYFGMFQDDIRISKDVREYFEKTREHGQKKSYWNLFTMPATYRGPQNQELCPEGLQGWYPSNQMGRGALALIFDNNGVQNLLSSRNLVERANAATNRTRGIDQTVCETLKAVGYVELVHNPSLVQHVSESSTIGSPQYPQASSFRGEKFSALSLLPLNYGWEQ